jgi:hypothetical protein
LKGISAVDTYASKEDYSLETLLELDGEIIEVGGRYWVEIRAKRLPATRDKPGGIDYDLCLLGPDGTRLVCYDNAHPVRVGSGPSRKLVRPNDHKHLRDAVRPYKYVDAGRLMEDFWTDVERVLKEEGVQ